MRPFRSPGSPQLTVATAVVVVLVGAVLLTAVGGAPSTDPVAEPVPVPEYVEDARSFVAAVDFTTPESGTALSVEVAAVATPGTGHLNPEVVLRRELEGTLRGTSTMPHPAMSFADGFGFFFEPGRVDLLAPFDADVETLRLRNAAGADIAVIDTAPAIREYCIENPTDPDCFEADLAVESVTPAGPLFAVLGEAVTVSVTSVVANLGPDGPVDVIATRGASAGTGLSVSPATPRSDVIAGLAVGATASRTDTWTVTCTDVGVRTLTLETAVTPRRAKVVDPEADNDRRSVTLPLDCAIPIAINIQPRSARNPVNLNGSIVPVAALTTAAGEYGKPVAFDATTIEASTVRFGSRVRLLAGDGAVEIHDQIHPEDSYELDERTRDRDLDALLHFGPRSPTLVPSDTEGCLFGRAATTAGSVAFFGCDQVTIIG